MNRNEYTHEIQENQSSRFSVFLATTSIEMSSFVPAVEQLWHLKDSTKPNEDEAMMLYVVLL